ncbi:hypothetical protein V6N12_071591 [Hibiscus sabdariffa]|uniref:Exocyst subunit Exo70 family protein n=1 Tax=Hibiscus sabdariffa TaxID=183260 RepID=A0ABR2FKE5_9ROSI
MSMAEARILIFFLTFEEAIKFLTGNCNIEIQWLQGATQFLEGNFIADDWLINSGILSFLRFGMSIGGSKKGPTKLLRLLNIFSVLEDLRMDFNKLFGGESCNERKKHDKGFVTKVVNGGSEIFWELPLEVELERRSSLPSDGGIPRPVSFMTDYCNRLLDENSRLILTQVLRIYQSWKHEKYDEGFVTNQIYRMVRETAVNLDVWSKAYEQRALSYIFTMNSHCHFNILKGTKLGNLMGDSWLNANGKYKEYLERDLGENPGFSKPRQIAQEVANGIQRSL